MLHLLYPTVNKYCKLCYKLNDNSIYIELGSSPPAWWARCEECRIIKS